MVIKYISKIRKNLMISGKIQINGQTGFQ